MDYETFAQANMHNCRSVMHLFNLISTRVDGTPNFNLFLGAGASSSSGIRTASSMIEEWQHRLFAIDKTKDEYHSWLEKQEWHNLDDQYSKLFELVYDQPSQRRAYIENLVVEGKPGWGYAYLVGLIEENIFNVIFTTNFDDLINEACYSYGKNVRPLVCAHDSAVSSIRITSDRPKVIKLHGDFLYDSIKNTSTELQNLENNMRDKFMEFAREFGMVVIGYSGCDKSVMDLLDVLVRSPQYFKQGIYWCILKGDKPCSRLRQLLRNDRVFWIEIEGFDEVLAALCSHLNISLPTAITSPHEVAIRKILHLVSDELEPTLPKIIQDQAQIRERLKRLGSAIEQAGFSKPKKRTASEGLGMLKSESLPILTGFVEMDQENYEEAINQFKQCINSHDIDIRRDSRDATILCYLCLKDKHAEALTLIKADEPILGGSSHYFMINSYYSLYLNESEYALEQAERALKINPTLSPALVNKGMAQLQLKINDQLQETIRQLTNPNNEEHHQAAGWALAGDFSKMVSCLQRAIVLRKYSAKRAFIDVIFRPYWDYPRFQATLKPFITSKEPKIPLLKTCLPSDPEVELRKRVEAEME